MQTVMKWLIDTVLVAIPENIILTISTLILLKRNDLLDFRSAKYNIIQMLIPSIPTAILLMLCKHAMPNLIGIGKLMCFVVFYLLTILMLKKNTMFEYKHLHRKTFLYMLISMLFMIVLEFTYIPLILLVAKMSYVEYSANIWLYVLMSFVARIVQISILSIVIILRNNKNQFDVVDTLLKNKFFLYSSIILSAFFLTTLIYLIKLIAYDMILVSLPHIQKVIFVTLFVSLTPGGMLFYTFCAFNYISNKEIDMHQMLDNLLNEENQAI